MPKPHLGIVSNFEAHKYIISWNRDFDVILNINEVSNPAFNQLRSSIFNQL